MKVIEQLQTYYLALQNSTALTNQNRCHTREYRDHKSVRTPPGQGQYLLHIQVRLGQLNQSKPKKHRAMRNKKQIYMTTQQEFCFLACGAG